MQFASAEINVDESEPGGTFNVPVSLSAASDAGIAEMTWTINTSSSTVTTHPTDSDYLVDITSTASAQVQIAKGETSGVITFQINEDIYDEWPEVLVLDLSVPTLLQQQLVIKV